MNSDTTINTEVTTLGGGCFWCLEPIFDDLVGVEQVVVGYAGGEGPTTYEKVCTGTTGHAEVIQVTFDPQIISFEELLKVFFTFHDPTTLNRQGADVGTQYRSVVFYHDDAQKEAAKRAIQEIEAAKLWSNPIVTEVSPLEKFYLGEEYHQKYYRRNPNQGYCQVVIAPKVVKFRKEYVEKRKSL
jgi:peptide-methionine (S)-S-oxide reductase